MINVFTTRQLRYRCEQSVGDLHNELSLKQNGYAWQDNDAKVLAVAHCDFVKTGSDHFITYQDRVYTPRLDDRLGVFIILDVLKTYGLEYDILLTDDEEVGQSTAQYFDIKDYNWCFSFDRRGDDAVTYQWESMDKAVASCFKLGSGTFSDISFLSIPGVNVGVGYHDEHSNNCYADLDVTLSQVEAFVKFFHKYEDTKFSNKERARIKWYSGAPTKYAEGYGRIFNDETKGYSLKDESELWDREFDDEYHRLINQDVWHD